ncbi:hypothetical protein AAVH_18552 [Aphelenchoides avenae]|nr:hypothetical protein AAVH_18552 [Aphelenchus avenae]
MREFFSSSTSGLYKRRQIGTHNPRMIRAQQRKDSTSQSSKPLAQKPASSCNVPSLLSPEWNLQESSRRLANSTEGRFAILDEKNKEDEEEGIDDDNSSDNDMHVDALPFTNSKWS